MSVTLKDRLSETGFVRNALKGGRSKVGNRTWRDIEPEAYKNAIIRILDEEFDLSDSVLSEEDFEACQNYDIAPYDVASELSNRGNIAALTA